MKNPTALLSLLFLIVVSSCSRFQYATISSGLIKNETNEQIVENDTLLIKYSFDGYQCPVKISIYNKLDIPLYIDWGKSALVYNGRSYSYWNDVSTLNGHISGSQIRWANDISSARGTVTGTLEKPVVIDFIPPRSSIKSNRISVQSDFFKLGARTKQNQITISTSNGLIEGHQYLFNNKNSPLMYRSYLTLSTDENFKTSFFYDDKFWVSEIFETGTGPKILLGGSDEESDKFMLRKATGFGKVILGLTGATIIVLAVSASPSAQ